MLRYTDIWLKDIWTRHELTYIQSELENIVTISYSSITAPNTTPVVVLFWDVPERLLC